MTDPFDFADEFGPFKIVHIARPRDGLKAIVVVDNIACGPAIGGVRMAPDVSLEECCRLARAMTFKNAAAGLPHGGGKAVIVADPGMERAAKETLIRAFADAIRHIPEYIVGPDMGTNEVCMAWIQDEIGRSVGLPRPIGGIPLDEIGATGFGCAIAAEVAAPLCGFSLQGARIAIQGFGAVGRHAARFLADRGCLLVAASDSSGTLANPDGLDIEDLSALKLGGGALKDHPGGRAFDREAIVGIDCDIWIPAARPDVLTVDNVADLKARLVIQGANIPATEGAERILHERGTLTVPDFIANAGGVICASVEFHGGSESAAFAAIEEKIRRNTAAVLDHAREKGVPTRSAAIAITERTLHETMRLRRWS